MGVSQKQVVIESDPANAVKWCNDNRGGPWSLRFQLNYIRDVLRKRANVKIMYKGRDSDGIADNLAKQGIRRRGEFRAWL